MKASTSHDIDNLESPQESWSGRVHRPLCVPNIRGASPMSLRRLRHVVARLFKDRVEPALSDVLLSIQLKRTLPPPVRVLLAGLLGMTYAAVTITIIATLLTLLWGIAVGSQPATQVAQGLPTAVLVTLPVLGLTLGYLALGVGAIVGVACTVIGGGIAAGLEWAIVAGIGVMVGIGLRYARLELLIPGLVAGILTGGSTGFLVWLVNTKRELVPLSISATITYAVALVLITGYIWLVFDAVFLVLVAD